MPASLRSASSRGRRSGSSRRPRRCAACCCSIPTCGPCSRTRGGWRRTAGSTPCRSHPRATSEGFVFRLDVAKFFAARPPDDAALLAGLSDDPDRREPATIACADYLNRLAPLEEALRANGQWHFPHPWLMTFLGDRHVEAAVATELAALEPAADLGPLGQVVLCPIRASAISSPLLRLPSDELAHVFNLVRLPATDDGAAARRLVEANTATYRRVSAAGGTLYPVSALPLSRRQWRDHFDPAFARLEAAKRRYDPNNTLTPGYEVF